MFPHSRTLFGALLALLLLTSFATSSAQISPDWQQTGTLEAVIDGKNFVMHSFSSVIPEDAAERTTDPEAKALLEKLAGTEQNSATWMVTDPFVMGGMVLLEARMFVSIDTRTSEDPNAEGQVDIDFGLNMDTLELEPDTDVEVRYFPKSWTLSGFYALTEGTLTLDSVEVGDERTLVISGTISGTMSWQDGLETEHNPADTLSFEATFSIDRVTGSEVLTELLGQ